MYFLLYVFLILPNSLRLTCYVQTFTFPCYRNYRIRITANTSHKRGFSSLNTHHFFRLKQYPASLHAHWAPTAAHPSGAASHSSHLSLHRQLTALAVPSAQVGSSTPLAHSKQCPFSPSDPFSFSFSCYSSTYRAPQPLLGAGFHLANRLGFQPG